MARGNRLAGCLMLAMVLAISCAGAQEDEAMPVSQIGAMNYLSQFGYLAPGNPTSSNIISESTMRDAITEFQAFAGLNVTGEMNMETAEKMMQPRCGVKDKIGMSAVRSKRYALQGSRWRVKYLTYRITNYPSKLNRARVDQEIRNAFNVWSSVTDLRFQSRARGNVHIEIRFAAGEHGDGDPFDGPGGTLAHAYFPVYGGDVHFDESENWSMGSYRGTNLFQVAAHEIGHSLGLSHSDVKYALMAPFYRGYEPHFTLHRDDIAGIQALYGKKSRQTATEDTPKPGTATAAPSGEEDAILCKSPKVDTIFSSAEKTIYVFKGENYWKLTDSGIAPNYPKLISSSWIGLPGNIDAAFTYRNGKTYFFKGTQYWRYIGKNMDGEYPKQISDGFTGIPDNIDAAVAWTGNGKIYFYKGTKFWRFDPSSKPPVKSVYPKELSNWDGIPDNIDAAVVYNKRTFFFKDDKYYRFNDQEFKVDEADPPFPRLTAPWWFGCKSTSRRTSGNVQWRETSPEEAFLNVDNMESADGGWQGDYDKHDNFGNSMFNAGETDEQLVTSPNHNHADSSGVLLESSMKLHLLLGILTMIIAKLVAAT
ncbi:hypothetical protein KM043_007789 [Ampulex compressa]|nr:hypothetical protein KM043_007789 [Ampulex compressa]